MTDDTSDISLSITLMAELVAADQMIQTVMARHLPKDMPLSHFSVLNHLRNAGEISPAQLARNFHLTKGAITNTLQKLEVAGYIHIRPDWDDARKKLVAISPAGRAAQERALADVTPVFESVLAQMGATDIKTSLPILRAFRQALSQP